MLTVAENQLPKVGYPKYDSYIKELEGIKQKWEEGSITYQNYIRKTINAAVDRIDIDTPEWSYQAAHSVLHEEIYPTIKENRNGMDFPEFVHFMVGKGLFADFLIKEYTNDELVELMEVIDHSRDSLFNFAGIRLLADRYLARNGQGWLLEYPQERFMIIAMTVLRNQPRNKRIEYIKEGYWALSTLKMTTATPTLSNSGKTHGQLSSCFIDIMPDSLEGIYDTDKFSAQVSKNGGGQGIYMGRIRGRGSDIRGFKDISSGVIPWLQKLNNTAVSVDQLGMRAGAFAVYLDIWHWDVMEFLDIRTNNGDDRLRARDIFPGLCIPDYFMELAESDETGRMKNPNATFFLLDPHSVETVMGYRLEDFYDEQLGSGSWRKRYLECIAHPDIRKREVKVADILKAIARVQLETSLPYMFYRDTANRLNPNKHKGMIYCSNLCTEIMQNMKETRNLGKKLTPDGRGMVEEFEMGDYVVCNLSSINLGKVDLNNLGDLERLINIQIRMLDGVIDVNTLPLMQAEYTNKRYRSLGLGTFGWHEFLARNKVDWNSERSVEIADELYEKIAYYTISASSDLAAEQGTYDPELYQGSDWDTGDYFIDRNYITESGENIEGNSMDWASLRIKVSEQGMRNAYLMAVAPNSSTAVIAGSTQGIDPFYNGKGLYVEEKKSMKVPIVAPGMSPETFLYYHNKGAYQVDQVVSIRQNAKRQRHVDQAVSFNLYIKKGTKAKDLLELHRTAWRNGLKTTYYMHNTPNEVQEDDCEACQ